ncbi:nuclease-related domain-containing DEAD/DEAH box helicase [uncultured Flavonifractor sp.]|uniref:nuclease-related domain-containing DEAD/DEAH box helicase n=1 Tax=uncultured Flavonifractor sp. TaxID=1193534 RepID=UPI00262456D7|nr:nuclease-related domain-containing DEAD/DEAH box helicase [uncultured Flavonifractor sp.]
MAIMHPPRLLKMRQIESEYKFFEACRTQLSDKFHVFYSLRWWKNAEGKREEGECDFLIFSPEYGFLCVEVKGGDGIDKNGRTWILLDQKNGDRLLHMSPYDQASKSMYYFRDAYKKEYDMDFPGIYGSAAAFPFYCIPEHLTVDAPPALTIDPKDMDHLETRIKEIFQYFLSDRKKKNSFLSPEAKKKFIHLVNKRVMLSPSADALIADREIQIAEMDRVQEAVIDLLAHYPRAFLVGGAGTGKTWIAIKKVQRCIQSGQSALYLCYNKALAEYVRTILPEQADCWNIDALAYSLLKDKALSAPESRGVKAYSDLLDALPQLPKYDLVVVDEGQDFTEDWAYCANLLTKEDGSLYVFYDESQNIFNRSFGDKFFIDEPPFVLRYNIRNTANIYKYAQQNTGLGLDTLTNPIEGVEPEFHRFTRPHQALAFLDTLIHKLVDREGVPTDRFMLLSNRKKENSILADTTTLGGYPLSDGSAPAGADQLTYRTIQSFKGLESDIVIFLNHTYKNEPQTDETRATLYTAMTRARFYLYVIDYEDNLST